MKKSLAATERALCLLAVVVGVTLASDGSYYIGPLKRESPSPGMDQGFMRALERLDQIKEQQGYDFPAYPIYIFSDDEDPYYYMYEYDDDEPEEKFYYFTDEPMYYEEDEGEGEGNPLYYVEDEGVPMDLADLTEPELLALLEEYGPDNVDEFVEWMTWEENKGLLDRFLTAMEEHLLRQLMEDVQEEQEISSLVGSIQSLKEQAQEEEEYAFMEMEDELAGLGGYGGYTSWGEYPGPGPGGLQEAGKRALMLKREPVIYYIPQNYI